MHFLLLLFAHYFALLLEVTLHTICPLHFLLLPFGYYSTLLLEVNLYTIYPLSLGKSLLLIFLEKLTSTFDLFAHYLFPITWTNFCPILVYSLFPYYLANFTLFFHAIYLLLPRKFHLLTLERLLEVLFF